MWGGISAVSRCDNISDKTDIYQTVDDSLFIEAIYYGTTNPPNTSIFNQSCFSLDGKKLIKISPDTAAAASTEFRFENDDFSKITLELGLDTN